MNITRLAAALVVPPGALFDAAERPAQAPEANAIEKGITWPSRGVPRPGETRWLVTALGVAGVKDEDGSGRRGGFSGPNQSAVPHGNDPPHSQQHTDVESPARPSARANVPVPIGFAATWCVDLDTRHGESGRRAHSEGEPTTIVCGRL